MYPPCYKEGAISPEMLAKGLEDSDKFRAQAKGMVLQNNRNARILGQVNLTNMSKELLLTGQNINY